MDYKNKYLKYKNKYLELKKRITMKGGDQFTFIKKEPMHEDNIQTLYLPQESVNTNLKLIAVIRELYNIPPVDNFTIRTEHNVIKSTEKILRSSRVSNLAKIVITPEYKIAIDVDGETVMNKLFVLLMKYRERLDTQIIVVPLSSNSQLENSEKNIVQQFQPSSINRDVSDLIYVLFDTAFFQNINKEFFDYINFYEKPELVDELYLTSIQKNKIKVFFKPKYNSIEYKNGETYEVDMKEKKEAVAAPAPTLDAVAAPAPRETEEYEIPSKIFSNYIRIFQKNVVPLIYNKNVTFYVINFNVPVGFNSSDLCKDIGRNCIVCSFEGEKYD
jgi:hypothetical protein